MYQLNNENGTTETWNYLLCTFSDVTFYLSAQISCFKKLSDPICEALRASCDDGVAGPKSRMTTMTFTVISWRHISK